MEKTLRSLPYDPAAFMIAELERVVADEDAELLERKNQELEAQIAALR